MAQMHGMPKRAGDGTLVTPDRRPAQPVRWGSIFLFTLCIIFGGELLVMGLVLPQILPEGIPFWQETIIDAILLSAFTALALMPLFSRFERRSSEAEHRLNREKAVAEESLLALTTHQRALDQIAIVAETTPRGEIMYANDRFCDISGYSREELIGNTHRMVNSGFHPKEFWREFWDTINAGQVWRGEICNRSKSGALYWVDSTIVPFTDGIGNITKFVAIRIEITRRKMAEESTALRIRMLHTLSEIAELPEADPTETLACAIELARQELGFERATLGRISGSELVFEVTSPAREPGMEPDIHPVSETFGGITLESSDLRFSTRVSSSPFADLPCFRRFGYECFIGAPVLVAGTTYGTIDFFSRTPREKDFDEAEKEFVRLLARLLGAVIARRDAMEGLAAKNRDLDVARKQAEEFASQAGSAARAKADFLANMSHEIRTPLNAIVGMTDLLMDSDLPENVREHLGTIRTSSDALLYLINDILDFSKIESGHLELEEHPVNIRECIEAVLELNASNADQKHLDLLYWIEPDVPATMVSDRTRLQQILMNLVANAVKFTEKGEVLVRVRLMDSPSGENRVHFSVRDTGIGIPQDRLNRLFQVFSQVDSSTTRRFGGTGLGLAISRRLVELMGGTIRVQSSHGHGSDFQFEVPLRAGRELPTKPIPSRKKLLAGLNVLVVDDNATNRWILSGQTRGWGMVPIEAAGAREALAIEEAGRPIDLVLLDVQMPDMDGYTLAGELRARRPELAMIVLTSLGDHDRSRMQTLRISGFLTKPVKAAQLYETICTTVSGVATTPALPPDSGDMEIAGECPLKLLVAEDNPTNQRIIRLLLERLGYRPEIVGNGLEVLAALRSRPFDAIILDVQMPEMDGLTAAREICRKYPRGRRPWMLAMTANALEGDREKCLAAGLDDYVSKPVRTADLSAALRRAYSRGGPSLQTAR